MGIERFFSSLNRQFDVVTDLKEPYKKIDSTHLLIDFNSIIHNVSSKMLSDINKFKQKKLKKLDFEFTTMDTFEKVLISQVKKSILDMLTDNFVSNNLLYIMLAIDGVPSFAKMIEQKKRRYIGDLLSNLMKKFELPVEWSKNNISPGTKFMDLMSKGLKDKQFLDKCKTICNNLEGIFVSDIYNPGEGEMKIMSCLRSLKNTINKICVYSPDSDMILLLMLLDIPVTLLRYDQQKSQKEEQKIFNQIDVQVFKNELINYCNSRLGNENKLLDRILIDEIVYIFTLFGDDFLPKTESISVSEDINIIIDNYLLTIIDKGNLLISNKKNKKINHDNLKHYFKLLSKTEIDDLNRFFYNSKYVNYRWAKNQNFHYDLLKLKIFIESEIKKFNINNNLLGFQKFIRNSESVQSYLEKVFSNNKHLNDPYSYFIYNILKILDGYELYNILYKDGKLLKVRSLEEQKIISKYKSLYYLKVNQKLIIEDVILYLYLEKMQFPFINFRLDSPDSYQYYIERKYEQRYHVGKMKRKQLFKDGNERDKLDYIIQNKLDEYYTLFNPVNFFYKTKITSTEKYYNVMFPNQDKKEIISKYIQGFEWILNYYLNDQTDILWFYPFPRTPLLSDVVNIYDKIDKKQDLNFDQNRIFNPLESIIFITPLDITSELLFFPDVVDSKTILLVKKFIAENQHFFLNLKEINTQLLTNPGSLTDLLDCSVSIFLSKCHYKLLDHNINPELFINKFRKIIPLKNQPLINKTDFKCYTLRLN